MKWLSETLWILVSFLALIGKASLWKFLIFRQAVKWLAFGLTIVCSISYYGSLSSLTKLFQEMDSKSSFSVLHICFHVNNIPPNRTVIIFQLCSSKW
jgi:hypothetical protein